MDFLYSWKVPLFWKREKYPLPLFKKLGKCSCVTGSYQIPIYWWSSGLLTYCQKKKIGALITILHNFSNIFITENEFFTKGEGREDEWGCSLLSLVLAGVLFAEVSVLVYVAAHHYSRKCFPRGFFFHLIGLVWYSRRNYFAVQQREACGLQSSCIKSSLSLFYLQAIYFWDY